MPKQTGPLRIKGKLGDLSFGEKVVRPKGGVSKTRMQTDPAFEKTRHNQAEFGAAATAAKFVRRAFRLLLKNTADSKLGNRLMGKFKAVIKSDTTNVHGQRKIESGQLQLLKGFEFNARAPLATKFFAVPTVNVQRGGGNVLLTLQPFVPVDMLTPPPGATHFKVIAGAADIDFSTGVAMSTQDEIAPLPIDSNVTAAMTFDMGITTNTTEIVIVVLGVQFYESQGNNQLVALKTTTSNSLAIVEVSKP
jgi:hypothetical protein